MKSRGYCNDRVMASRIETDTLSVEHVCAQVRDHSGDHQCSCEYRWPKEKKK
jgi:hypothetical protein